MPAFTTRRSGRNVRTQAVRDQPPLPFQLTLGLLCLLLPLWTTYWLSILPNGRFTPIYFLPYCFLSIVSFLTYRRDKAAAVALDWRVRERTLLLRDLLGGWPGGLAAQWYYRHKTRKLSFQIRFWLIVFIHQFFFWCVRSTF